MRFRLRHPVVSDAQSQDNFEGLLLDLGEAITTIESRENNSAYKMLAGGQGLATLPVDTYYLSFNGYYASGTATTSSAVPIGFDFTSGDYDVSSLTTQFEIKQTVFTGSTSPSTVVITAGLYPVTVSGGNYTLGTVVTGSTAASSGLSTNTVKRFSSGDFAASALTTNPGFYCIGVAVSSITVPAGISLHLELLTRHT